MFLLLLSSATNTQEFLRQRLFERAAKDPIDMIYADNPGETRKVKQASLLKVMKWQIVKDRANYKGKPPKRVVVWGSDLPFDWAGELAKIEATGTSDYHAKPRKVSSVKKDQVESPQVSAVPEVPVKMQQAESPQVSAVPEVSAPSGMQFVKQVALPSESFDCDSLSSCLKCGLAVWIGPKENAPGDVVLAYPLDTEWSDNHNVEPYCKECWGREEKLLEELVGQHKAIGGPTVDQKKKNKANAAKKKKEKAVQRKKKKNSRAKEKEASCAKEKEASCAKEEEATGRTPRPS